jgi:hypothetical protein
MKEITGQVMYLGPRIQHIGLGYGALFRDGIHKSLYPYIEQCPSIGALIVPVADVGLVRRQLNFDYAHNMKGTVGKFVTYYQAIQAWLVAQKQKTTSTVEQKSYA